MQIKLGDRVGFDTVRSDERHFSRDLSILDPAMVRQTMTLFADKIMPHFR